MNERSLHIEVHQEDGMLWAEISEWPGCFASGETFAELIDAIQEAVALYITPEDQPVEAIKLHVQGLDVQVASEAELRPARKEAVAGPLSTPPRTRDPHRSLGAGGFGRR